MRAQFIGTACGLALVLGAVSVPAAGAATVATCNGVRATIVSSAAKVTGTAARDVIVGTRTSGQTINSLGGNDIICASSGPDVINAGDGSDMVLAGLGNDRIDGGAGADMVNGGAGTDTLTGGLGNDSLNGGMGSDALTPGAGTNVCSTDPLDTLVAPCPPDTTAPVISAVSVPSSVTAGNTLSLSFDVADVGGVTNAFFTISGASGWATTWCGFGTDAPLVAGTPFAGTYAASCSVPTSAANGTYTLWLDAQDSFGNLTTSTQVDFQVGGGVADTTVPVISAVSVPSSVTAGGALSLRFDVADAGGVSNSFFKISGASGWVSTWCGFGTDAPLTSGTRFAGTYAASCPVPAAAVNGTYTLWLDAQDSFGNFTTSTQVDFQVVGGSTDSAAPVVSEASARTVSGSPGSVVVRWRATDETGVGGAAAYLALNGYSFADNTGASYFDSGAPVTRVSGDANDGIYEVTLVRRSNAPAGIYTLWISIIDTLGNKVFQMQPPNSPVTVTLP